MSNIAEVEPERYICIRALLSIFFLEATIFVEYSRIAKKRGEKKKGISRWADDEGEVVPREQGPAATSN